MIAFVRKEVGKWKKDHFNLVSWTLERLYVLLLKLEYKTCGAFDNCKASSWTMSRFNCCLIREPSYRSIEHQTPVGPQISPLRHR